MVGEIVAEEDVIKELEAHIEKPHGIADQTFLYKHKNLYVTHSACVRVMAGVICLAWLFRT